MGVQRSVGEKLTSGTSAAPPFYNITIPVRLLLASCATLLLLAVCGRAGESAPDVDATAPTDTATADPVEGETLTMDGFGAIRIGLTPDALRAAGLTVERDTLYTEDACYYVRIAEAPDSLFFMVEEGTLARIDVHSRAVTTPDGDRVGDPEADVLARHPDAAVQPHKYTDGHYLVVLSPDSSRALVFETDGTHVTEFRAGRRPAVEYVEGCS